MRSARGVGAAGSDERWNDVASFCKAGRREVSAPMEPTPDLKEVFDRLERAREGEDQ
jgi:hypothetical protein